MVSRTAKGKFILYPDPIRAPDVPYVNTRKPNPAMRGWLVVAAAFLLETFGWLRLLAWRNAGFGSLRKIHEQIKLVEPWYDPTVFPLESEVEHEDAAAQQHGESRLSEANNQPNAVARYHETYLSRVVTPLDVVHALLPLIRKDVDPPGEHSLTWFQLEVDIVLKAAEASTKRFRDGESLGLLDGVPIAIKDEYDMEGYVTTLGSPNDYTGGASVYKGRIDAWCIRKLEEAGAILLGKISMHEFGMDTSGNNLLYGTPRNPYNQQYYTGGSSSGCAYAVAYGLVPIALGSDGGGSIRIPSSFCSVFGLKPSHGRVSFFPNQNHSKTCGVNGPMAADIHSLIALYNVISQPDPTSYFPSTTIIPTKLLTQTNRSKIIGIPESWFARATPAIQTLCNAMISRLVKEKGYTVVPISIPYLVEGQIAHALTILTDGATLLPNTRGLSPANRILLALGSVTPSTDYLLAQKLRRVLMQHLAWLWQSYPGMVIVTPTTACAGWPIRSTSELKYGVSDGDQTLATMEYVWLANFSGVPSINVPAGYVVPEGGEGGGEVAGPDVVGKVPVGLMAMGDWAGEEALLGFGLDAEELASEFLSRPPGYVDVLDLARQKR